jgi:ParB/RepB/Spo0J family partition protein
MSEKGKNKPLEKLNNIDVKLLVPTPDNPRTINEKSQEFLELLASVEKNGVRIPVHVRPDPKKKDQYELLAGERRLRASIMAKKPTIPAIVHEGLTDEEAFEITFLENFARKDLTVMEQSRACETLLLKYKGDVTAAASKMGKSIRWVNQRVQLHKGLSKDTHEFLNGDDPARLEWTAAHLQAIVGLPHDMQDKIIEYYRYDDPPSVKDLEKEISDQFRFILKAVFDTKDDKLIDGVKACAKCKKRTAAQPGLFDDTTDAEQIKKNDRCMDEDCWDKKQAAGVIRTAEELSAEKGHILRVASQTYDWSAKQDLIKRFGDVIWKGEYTTSKEGAKDAHPAINVDGGGIGTLTWIKISGAKGLEGSSRSSSRNPKVPGKPTPLKDRRAAHDSKRWFQVLRDLIELVKKSTVDMLVAKDKQLFVTALAAYFGTKDIYYHSVSCDKFDSAFEKAKSKKGSLDIALAALWKIVIPTLVTQITYNDAITRVPKERIRAGRLIARWLGIDIDAMFAEEAKKQPEPKAWASLNADGTPKKAKPKTARPKLVKNKTTTLDKLKASSKKNLALAVASTQKKNKTEPCQTPMKVPPKKSVKKTKKKASGK